MKKNLVIVAVVTALFDSSTIAGEYSPTTPQSSASETAIADLVRAEGKRANAIMQKDIQTLRYLLGASYYHVESNGRIRSKVEFIRAIERGEFALLTYRIEQSEYENLGDIAIARGVQVIERSTATGPRYYKLRYLRIWRLSGSSWINISHQATEIRLTQDATQQ